MPPEVNPHLSLLMLLHLKAWRSQSWLNSPRRSYEPDRGKLLLLGPEQLSATPTNPAPARGVRQQRGCAGRGHLAQSRLVALGSTLSSLTHPPRRDPKSGNTPAPSNLDCRSDSAPQRSQKPEYPSSKQSGLQERCNPRNAGCILHSRTPKH